LATLSISLSRSFCLSLWEAGRKQKKKLTQAKAQALLEVSTHSTLHLKKNLLFGLTWPSISVMLAKIASFENEDEAEADVQVEVEVDSRCGCCCWLVSSVLSSNN